MLHRCRKMLYKVKSCFSKCHIHADNTIGERVLLIALYDAHGIETVKRTIFEYKRYSSYSVDIINVQEGLGRLSSEDLCIYKAIIIHDTAAYNINLLYEIYNKILKHYTGVKVVWRQDEHDKTNLFIDFFDKIELDFLLSIWDVATAEKIYKNNGKNRKLVIMNYLTGYVPDSYKKKKYWSEIRNVDVGYRGSLQPTIYGRLAYEKHFIGDEFVRFADQYHLKCDISSKWDDRIYGEKWLYFIGSCKAMLGVESGSDIVDFDGSVKAEYDLFLKEHPNSDELERLDFLKKFEGKISYRAVSPRLFEAAACGTLQILFEGEYQGIFKQYEHYIPLKRDFSNIDEVVNYIRDDKLRKKIVDYAYEDIILSGKYSFESFVEKHDSYIKELEENKRSIS